MCMFMVGVINICVFVVSKSVEVRLFVSFCVILVIRLVVVGVIIIRLVE